MNVGPYQVVRTIGQGGMGTVYRARDKKLHRNVALKVLLSAGEADPEAVERFRREALLTAKLSHPGIVGIQDYGVDRGHVRLYLSRGQAAAFRRGVRPRAVGARVRAPVARRRLPASGRRRIRQPRELGFELGDLLVGGLDPRQLQVLRLVADGLSYKEVWAQLYLSPRTIKYHMGEIMDRLHLENRAQVLAHAGRMGWTNDTQDSE